VPAGPEDAVRAALRRSGFDVTWFFEKRRKPFKRAGEGVSVVIDEIPEIGHFVEIEGSLDQVRHMEQALSESLGPQETKNYRELFVAFKEELGLRPTDIKGASFR